MPSESRHRCLNRLLGWLRGDAESDCIVGVDDCEAIALATQIERVTFDAIDMQDLTWFKADPYASSCGLRIA